MTGNRRPVRMRAITSASSPFPTPRTFPSMSVSGAGPSNENHARGVSSPAYHAALCSGFSNGKSRNTSSITRTAASPSSRVGWAGTEARKSVGIDTSSRECGSYPFAVSSDPSPSTTGWFTTASRWRTIGHCPRAWTAATDQSGGCAGTFPVSRMATHRAHRVIRSRSSGGGSRRTTGEPGGRRTAACGSGSASECVTHVSIPPR
jgi:hypothetical protein